MNIHDQARKDALIKTLIKAKEQADTARTYLVAHDRDPEDIMTNGVVMEHIDNALEQLGTLVPTT